MVSQTNMSDAEKHFKNAEKLSMNSDVSLLEKDATGIWADEVSKDVGLVFIDPPYEKKLEFKAIKNLIKKKIKNSSGKSESPFGYI